MKLKLIYDFAIMKMTAYVHVPAGQYPEQPLHRQEPDLS